MLGKMGVVLLGVAGMFAQVDLPKSATAAELEAMRAVPQSLMRKTTPPPTGPIWTPAEYDATAAILLSYNTSSSSIRAIMHQMAAHITTTGNADVIVMAQNAGEAATILSNMTAAGANPARVKTLIYQTNSIWIRDYGPRYIYEGGCRAIIDHTYNRPRPLDDAQPAAFAQYRNHARYEIPLVHGGGNYHLHADGDAHATLLIQNENVSLTQQEIHDLWQAYQNVDTRLHQPFPTFIDSTQHIDMWMIALADKKTLISDWPNNPGSTQDQICDNASTTLQGLGYEVHRVPAFSVGGTHYTYTNAVICNDLVLVPSYTNGTVSPSNAAALAAWQAALPGKTIEAVDCQAIVTLAGVMHCIAMHLPAHSGGVNPTVYLQTRFTGQTLVPGNQVNLRWISDDDQAVDEVDLAYSLDGGASFFPIANGLPPLGTQLWTVPAAPSATVHLRAIARDLEAQQGQDLTDAFTIASGACRGDVAPIGSPDGQVDSQDLLQAISLWRSQDSGCDVWPLLGAFSWGDGLVTVQDLLSVLQLFGPCP